MGVRLCQPMSKSKINTDVENTVLKSVITFMRYSISTADANQGRLAHSQALSACCIACHETGQQGCRKGGEILSWADQRGSNCQKRFLNRCTYFLSRFFGSKKSGWLCPVLGAKCIVQAWPVAVSMISP